MCGNICGCHDWGRVGAPGAQGVEAGVRSLSCRPRGGPRSQGRRAQIIHVQATGPVRQVLSPWEHPGSSVSYLGSTAQVPFEKEKSFPLCDTRHH